MEAENEELKQERNHEGVIFFPIQKTIEKNKIRIGELQKRLNSKEDNRASDNREIKKSHNAQIDLTASTLAWILVILEILFEGCIAYIWYYYYRSFIEREQSNGSAKSTAELAKMAQYLQSEISRLQKTSSYQQNGSSNYTPQNVSTRKPIGFYTSHQLAEMGVSTINDKKSPSQACTGLYRQAKSGVDDIYTIEHQYQKGKDTITVRYTEQQIKARLQQWQRDFEKAKARKMETSVIENRAKWVSYWTEKLDELKSKKDYILDTQKTSFEYSLDTI